MPVCITGMHRSGTSMVTRLLNLCGLDLGRAEDLVNPAPDNPEGYWENNRFIQLDTRLLNAFNGDWDLPPTLPGGWEHDPRVRPLAAQAGALLAEFRATPRWGWKDPRASLTLAFWQALIPDLQVVICVRNPLQVARSLYRRGYNSTVLSLALWETYNRSLLRAAQARGPDCYVVTHHDAFFHDPAGELKRVVTALGWSVPEPTLADACRAVSLSLRHNFESEEELRAVGASAELLALYAELVEQAGPIFQQARRAGAPPRPSEPGPNGSRPLTQVVTEQQTEMDSLSQENARLRQEYGRLEAWAHELETRALARVAPLEWLMRRWPRRE